jgi:molybdate transport system substrate-binding protein
MKYRLFMIVSTLTLLVSACRPQPAAIQPAPLSPTAAPAQPATAAPTTVPTAPAAAMATTAPTPAATALPTSAAAPSTQAALSGTLNVFAAASLTGAFNEIGKAFEAQHPGVKITFNYAGSQQLAQQINSGAPVDVFASANKTQMDAAAKSGRIDPAAEQNFVKNRLVVIYPKANPGGVRTLQDLAKPGLKLILADKSVPVGQYALSFLDNAVKDSSFGPSYKDAVLKNVVSYEQDVKSVLTKVELGEADAGIVYTTDAASDTAGKTTQLAIPDALNVIATYPIAALKDSPNLQLAQAFAADVLSSDGQTVLTKYGFIPAE